jgi:hypothetical protein
MTSDGHRIILGGNLHAISFKNNITILANRTHLQKLGHFESHNDYLILPLIMTLTLQMTSDGNQIIPVGNIHIISFDKNLFFKLYFRWSTFEAHISRLKKTQTQGFVSPSHILSPPFCREDLPSPLLNDRTLCPFLFCSLVSLNCHSRVSPFSAIVCCLLLFVGHSVIYFYKATVLSPMIITTTIMNVPHLVSHEF